MSNQNEKLRHYGTFQGEEVIIIGYKKSQNVLLICKVNALPSGDQMELRKIASSKLAQETADYLVELLQQQHHQSGTDWFAYLAPQIRKNVLQIVSIKDVADMNDEQKSFFKGYGHSVRNLKNPENAEERPMTARGTSGKTPAGAAPATDPAMLAILQSLAVGQQQINESLAILAKRPVPAAARIRPSRAKAKAEKAAAKAAAASA
jgi:hypothetical protein